MLNLVMAAQAIGVVGETRGTSILDGSPWSRCYVTSDNGWLSVQCLEPKFYAAFLDKLGVTGDDASALAQAAAATVAALTRKLGA